MEHDIENNIEKNINVEENIVDIEDIMTILPKKSSNGQLITKIEEIKIDLNNEEKNTEDETVSFFK